MFVALRFYGGILTILLDYIVNTDSWLIKRLLNRSSFNNCLGPDWLNYGFEVLCVTCIPIDYSISQAWSLAASDLLLSPALIVQRSRGRKAAQQPPPLTWNLTQVCFITHCLCCLVWEAEGPAIQVPEFGSQAPMVPQLLWPLCWGITLEQTAKGHACTSLAAPASRSVEPSVCAFVGVLSFRSSMSSHGPVLAQDHGGPDRES